jgi:glutamine amidotransferase
MYLVHSFYAPKCKEAIALTNYEMEYATALQKDNFYGVQFHPEKSGKFGEQILKNFLLLTPNF